VDAERLREIEERDRQRAGYSAKADRTDLLTALREAEARVEELERGKANVEGWFALVLAKTGGVEVHDVELAMRKRLVPCLKRDGPITHVYAEDA